MTVLRDSAIMGAATFLVGAVFMEIGDDEGIEFDKTFPYIATFLSGAIGYYVLKKTNITDSFSAEEKVKASKIKGEYGDKTKFSYKGHEAIYSYDDGNGHGDLKFINNFDERRMGEGNYLPHVKEIQGIKGKTKNPRHYFKQYLDRPCESCDEPIHKNGIGNCSFSYDDFDKEFKYEIKTPEGEDFIDSFLNRYCRKCLYFMGVGGTTDMPNEFDRKSSNYALGNALSEEAFNEWVEENYPVELAEGKKIPKHSLYDIENYNARREMALRRQRND